MSESTSTNPMDHELSPEGRTTIAAVDDYLEQTIEQGRPIEALIATKRLGEITGDRAKQAARMATEGAWSWTDVGKALGVSKQAAHEKLRTRVREEMDEVRSKLEQSERTGHAKIARRAQRGRERLEEAAPYSPKIDVARQRIDEWEQEKHDKLDRKIEKARGTVTRAQESAERKLEE